METGNDISHSHSGNPPQKGQTVEGTEAQMAKTQRENIPGRETGTARVLGWACWTCLVLAAVGVRKRPIRKWG